MEAMITLKKKIGKDMFAPCYMSEYFEGESWTESGYFWIDAVCINQEDILKRNAQVQLMGKLYKGASITFGYLRSGDEYSETAISMIINIFDTLTNNPTFFKKFGVSLAAFTKINITGRHWLAIFAFFYRLWFRRAWISQEIVFSRNMIMLCGPRSFPWVLLEEFA
jgi:hypothetical protein